MQNGFRIQMASLPQERAMFCALQSRCVYILPQWLLRYLEMEVCGNVLRRCAGTGGKFIVPTGNIGIL